MLTHHLSCSGQSPSPKPAPEIDEAPRFPFSIVKPPRSNRQSWQANHRQHSGSLSDLPLGAVAVPLSQASARTSLPSSASQDAHAQAALHSTAPSQSLSSPVADSHEALHMQESALAAVLTNDKDATDGQTGLVAGTNQPSALAAAAQHHRSTPDTEASLPAPVASAWGSEAVHASSDCTRLKAALADAPHKQATSNVCEQGAGECGMAQVRDEAGVAALPVDIAQAAGHEQQASDPVRGATDGFLDMPGDQHLPVGKKRKTFGA